MKLQILFAINSGGIHEDGRSEVISMSGQIQDLIISSGPSVEGENIDR